MYVYVHVGGAQVHVCVLWKSEVRIKRLPQPLSVPEIIQSLLPQHWGYSGNGRIYLLHGAEHLNSGPVAHMGSILPTEHHLLGPMCA